VAAADDLRSVEASPATVQDGYRRLAFILRSLVSEQSVDAVLSRIASDLRELVRCDDVVIWELLDHGQLAPTLVDGEDEVEMRALRIELGEGITGSSVLRREMIVSNNAHDDPRAGRVPGTRLEHEAIICVPFTARETSLGALSLYRRGRDRAFLPAEIELVRHFADVAAIALHNAKTVDELERLAGTDDLTGLANRRSFREALRRYEAAAERHKLPLSLLLLDIDGFKQINDIWGHERGDEFLRSFAADLRRRVRDSDIVARIGGDEFAILLPQTSEREASLLARELANQLQSPVAAPFPVGVSIGVASCPGVTCDALLSEADRELYVDKAQRARRRSGRSGYGRIRSAQPHLSTVRASPGGPSA
jgi:diguanylate cyclase (GGDEF)-like protein